MRIGTLNSSAKLASLLPCLALFAGVFFSSSHVFAAGSGVCFGRDLPDGKTRKWHAHRLVCVPEVDHYLRTTTPFDMNGWLDIEDKGGSDVRTKMQQFRQDAASQIEWSGSIPYSTVEEWVWVEWVYGYHFSCPSHTETYRDSDGKTQTRTVQPPCWHDEDRHEERHCSNEVMDFSAEFIRPSLQSWGPHIKDYYDVIPNKYDLLPGEMEDVQIFSNDSKDTKLSPTVAIGNAWNKYQPTVRFKEGGTSRTCKPTRGPIHSEIVVTVNTIERIKNRTTPNTLRIQTDEDGKRMNPLVFEQAQAKSGKFVTGNIEKIRLADVSTEVIKEMARQSRKFTAVREIEKQEKGEGRNTDLEGAKEFGEAAAATKRGFWKSTQVRVRLKENVPLEVDRYATRDYMTSATNITRNRGYEIEPYKSDESGKDLYRSKGLWANDSGLNAVDVGLQPRTNYYFEISVFQEGVPFYRQDAGFFGDARFSEPLVIEFKSSDYDERGSLQKLADFQAKPGWKKIWDLFF